MKTAFALAIGSLILFSLGVLAQTAPVPTPSPSAIAAASTGFLTWLETNGALILGVLFGISEALANIPAIKANSVFQAILSVLQALMPKTGQ